MHVNHDGLELIKEFEGYRANAYRCPAGVWTIGYGHTSMAGAPVVKRGMRVTRDEAHEILKNDLLKYEKQVNHALGDHVKKLNSNQYSACVSLCYNIGGGNFKSSSVVRYIKYGELDVAADKFLLWNKAGGRVLRGLTRRRKAERELFLRAL